ncbi:hypothetical protein OG524_22385 [Streptomyces sp. NBC_01520]|uniref:hypothetical protein n=1 Tax=Streptomyces sp. NBC_01520 TaxID=2903892 RepID=UPI00386CD4CF
MNRLTRITRLTHINGRGRTARSAARAVLVGGLALGLTACSGTDGESVEESIDRAVDRAFDAAFDAAVDETYGVTCEVTGTKVDEIRFHDGGDDGGDDATEPTTETVESPTLPWRKTVTLRGIMPPAVMQLAPESDDVARTTTYRGEVITEPEGEALLTSGGSIAVPPAVG